MKSKYSWENIYLLWISDSTPIEFRLKWLYWKEKLLFVLLVDSSRCVSPPNKHFSYLFSHFLDKNNIFFFNFPQIYEFFKTISFLFSVDGHAWCSFCPLWYVCTWFLIEIEIQTWNVSRSLTWKKIIIIIIIKTAEKNSSD